MKQSLVRSKSLFQPLLQKLMFITVFGLLLSFAATGCSPKADVVLGERVEVGETGFSLRIFHEHRVFNTSEDGNTFLILRQLLGDGGPSFIVSTGDVDADYETLLNDLFRDDKDINETREVAVGDLNGYVATTSMDQSRGRDSPMRVILSNGEEYIYFYATSVTEEEMVKNTNAILGAMIETIEFSD